MRIRPNELLPLMPLLLITGMALVVSVGSFFGVNLFPDCLVVGCISSGVLAIVAMFRQTGRLFLIHVALTVLLGLFLLVIRIGKDWAHGFHN